MSITIGKTKLRAQVLERFPLTSVFVAVPGLERPVEIRTATTDQLVFEKVFVGDDYQPGEIDDVRVIVDAGANVGYATLWFRRAWPAARIIAIEPDPANFEQLRRNVGHLPGIELVQGALWGEDTELSLQRSENGKPLHSWGTRTVEPDSVPAAAGLTRAFTLDTLAATYGLERLDYVKIDIEGAEKQVFESPARRWLERTRLIAVEFHDRFRPGCRAATEAALAGRGGRGYRKGENWFYRLA